MTTKGMGCKKGLLFFLILFSLPFALGSLQCDTNTYSEHGFGNDKVYWLCSLTNASVQYDCISYIKDNSSGIVQLNPIYQKKSESLIGVMNDVEDRESFKSENGLVSVFFTKENLLFDGRAYIYGVKCSGNGEIFSSEKNMTPEYSNVNEPVTRLFWLKGNLAPLMIGLFLAFVCVVLVAFLIRTARGK